MRMTYEKQEEDVLTATGGARNKDRNVRIACYIDERKCDMRRTRGDAKSYVVILRLSNRNGGKGVFTCKGAPKLAAALKRWCQTDDYPNYPPLYVPTGKGKGDDRELYCFDGMDGAYIDWRYVVRTAREEQERMYRLLTDTVRRVFANPAGTDRCLVFTREAFASWSDFDRHKVLSDFMREQADRIGDLCETKAHIRNMSRLVREAKANSAAIAKQHKETEKED